MADPTNAPTHEDYVNLTKAMNGANNNGGLTGMLKGLGIKAVAAAAGLEGLAAVVKGTEESYRKLSATGASFSNDLAAMNLAAVQSRMDLDEFADLISKNGRNLAGLGGNVTRGSESFAKIAKEFHDGDAGLRQMGYSMAEMNQLLTDQLAARRVTDVQDESERARVIKSTEALAMEMDMTAKLTGKNRAELTEQMRNRQSQARMEAAIALATRGMSKEQADAVRENINKMQVQAEATGMGQAFREMIETGTVYSETARTQAALGGQAFTELAKSSQLAKQGSIQEAQARMDSAKALAVQNQNDPRTQVITALSGAIGGSVGEVSSNMAADLKPMVDGLNSLAVSSKNLLQTQQDYQRELQNMVDSLRQAQQGRRKNEKGEYEQVDQVTKAITTLDKAADDVAATLADSVEKHVLPSMRNAAGKLAESIDPQKLQDGVSGLVDEVAKFVSSTNKVDAAFSAVGKAAESVKKTFEEDVGPYIKGIWDKMLAELKTFIGSVPGRKTGSLGETGNIIEDHGNGQLRMLHGRESVQTEDQMKNLSENTYNSGVSEAYRALSDTFKTIPLVEPTNSPSEEEIVTDVETGVTELKKAISNVTSPAVGNNAQYTAIDPAMKAMAEQQAEASKKADADRRAQNQKAEQDRQKSGAYIDKHKKASKDVAGAMKTVDADKSKETVVTANNPKDADKPDLNSMMLNADGSMSFAAKKQQEQKPQEQMGPPKPEEAKKEEEAKKTATQANQATIKQTDVMADILDQLKQLNARMASFMDQSEKLSKKQTNVIRQQNAL